jgi:hypothetical protein
VGEGSFVVIPAEYILCGGIVSESFHIAGINPCHHVVRNADFSSCCGDYRTD